MAANDPRLVSETIQGELQIDRIRGVIYFHTMDTHAIDRFGTITLLRLANLRLPSDLSIPIDLYWPRSEDAVPV